MATIHLTQEIPTVGALVHVKESAIEIASKMRAAKNGREDPTIRLHDQHDGSIIILPTNLIGPVTDR